MITEGIAKRGSIGSSDGASMFAHALRRHIETFEALRSLEQNVEDIGVHLAEALRAGNKIMLCGNGGSAADSQHIAAELTGRFARDRAPMAGLALSTDTSALTCIGNDFGFDEIFARQVQALGKPRDCLIAISTSGNSDNVIRAVKSARDFGVSTVGLLGRNGGKLAPLCDYSVVVPSSETCRIQEAHIFIGHLWCELIEAQFGAAS